MALMFHGFRFGIQTFVVVLGRCCLLRDWKKIDIWSDCPMAGSISGVLYQCSGPSRGGGYPGLLPRGPGQKGARTQTVTNLQVLQDMK